MNKEYANRIWDAYSLNPSRELRNELATIYLPLAAKIAGRFRGRGLDYDDLYQTASLALLKCIEGFQPDRETLFSTYAIPFITGAIQNELRDHGNLIRLPESQVKKRRLILQKQTEFEKQHFRTPTPQEIADELQMDAADVLLLTAMHCVSLDAFVSECGNHFADLLGETDPSFDRLEDKQWMEAIGQDATQEEKQLIEYRYGQGLSQRETAKQIGISQMQVSRMERRLLARLKEKETSDSRQNQYDLLEVKAMQQGFPNQNNDYWVQPNEIQGEAQQFYQGYPGGTIPNQSANPYSAPISSFDPNLYGSDGSDQSFSQFMNEAPSEPVQQETQTREARVIKKKQQRRTRLNYRGWILAFLFLLLLGFGIYMLFFRGSHGGTATIQYGKMGDNFSGTALIVRNETAFDEEGVQDIDFIAQEGSLITRGDLICRVYSTGYSSKEVNSLQGYRDQIKDYQRSLLSAETSYDQKMTRLENEVIDRGLEVRSLVHGARGDMISQEKILSNAISERQSYFRTKYSSDTRMNRLYDDENAQLQRIDSWIKNHIATSEGIVSFYTDGYEFILSPNTYAQYSPADVRSILAGNKPGVTSATKGKTSLYRIVQKNNYVILMLMDDTGWNPIEGQTYKLVLERYNDLVADAMVLSFTRAGGDLLVRLAVMGDVHDVLYMRSCSAQLGEYVDCLMVPAGALYQQGGENGVVILENGRSVFVPVHILGQADGQAYISATVTGSLKEGQTVRLFQ